MAAKPDNKSSEGKDKPPKRGKGLLIAVLVTALVAAGVGAGWYYTRPGAQTEGEAQAAVKPEPIFVNLDPFTVNLADEGGERLAQIAVVVELDNKTAQAALTKSLPVVRNSILLLLSAQHTKTLLTLDGKRSLAAEIALRTGGALGWRAEDGEEQETDEPKGAAAKSGATRPKSRPRRQALPNPVVAVHFAQLLVQ